ncbi:hypothetical protein GGX14DRAFT_480327 [Mycena pura]|uniref:Uncharacterized protein n=1 Tax=Mycena pura TaxID=153505 RepID=A0AAD6UUB7_9AGAR|nr:hypothetical protein GGX14DRAFT_480327 [Mycena pura]
MFVSGVKTHRPFPNFPTNAGEPVGNSTFYPQNSELPALAALKEFTGPCDYLLIARRAALTHLSITIFYTGDQLLTQLERLQNTATITSLLLRGDQPIDGTALDRIFTLCFRLVEFRLDSFEETAPKTARLCRALPRTPSLPPTLKSLCVFGMCFDESNPRGMNRSELQAIRAALVSRCPGLTLLWLSGPCFAFLWRKYKGEIFEKSAEGLHPASLQVLSLNVEDIWATR